ncbi:MAG: right-handed parallel beta-helix repeat-containing protein [Alphaproteobacteria bacterium]|nr:right-handed parallel beta-helix repeat-containing protein [Alphaproteobacteria bacterium]
MNVLKKFLRAYLIFLFVVGHVVVGIGAYMAYDRLGKSPRQIVTLGANKLKIINPALGNQILALTKTSREKSLSQIKLPSLSEWRGPGASTNRKSWRPAYDAQGKPLSEADFARGAKAAFIATNYPKRIVTVASNKELINAIRKASPGDAITIEPGTYYFKGHAIKVKKPGLPESPIVVRAKKLGTVILKFNLLEGFLVKAPFWVFENLRIEGICPSHSRCEHAFHVGGKGRSLVIRNNQIHDFNAQLKVNGGKRYIKDGKLFRDWPDYGLVEGNTVADSSVRATGNPVTKLNINGASSWVVRGNLIADFAKLYDNQISYAAFMKANSRNGVFENNAVICHMNVADSGGIRLGLSFGGGGTGQAYCRNQSCVTEHTGGVMRNNLILNCPKDVGIFLRRSKGTQIVNNTILNTAGVDVLFPTSSAYFANNIIEGRIKNRFGGKSEAFNNIIIGDGFFENRKISDIFSDVINADLKLLDKKSIVGQGTPIQDLGVDFCGNPRNLKSPDIGPLDQRGEKTCDVRDIWENNAVKN